MEIVLDRAELEVRIAEVADNLRSLLERAAAVSGAADDQLLTDQIEEQQTLFERLVKERDDYDQASLPLE
jgi:hypothetical protein